LARQASIAVEGAQIVELVEGLRDGKAGQTGGCNPGDRGRPPDRS